MMHCICNTFSLTANVSSHFVHVPLTGKVQLDRLWTKVATGTALLPQTTTTVAINPPISVGRGSKRGIYVVTSEGILLAGIGGSPTTDVNGGRIEKGTVVFNRFGNSYTGYSPNVALEYKLAP
jgi:hypothetical protein